jgi:hypothetical protein
VALLRELNNIIENDRYPLSPRIRTLREIRAKLSRRPRSSTTAETASHGQTPALVHANVLEPRYPGGAKLLGENPRTWRPENHNPPRPSNK